MIDNSNNNNDFSFVGKFDTDIDQLMNIIINSLYSNNDIFLRELISNSHDAIEKKRYDNLQNNNFINVNDFNVKIYMNKEKYTLYIQDNGIGMDKNELIENLGTIARSGTKKFIEDLRNQNNTDKSINQIGQFGLGFYSTFLVSNSVSVISKKNNNTFKWYSKNGDSNYYISDVSDENYIKSDSGTIIVLELYEKYNFYLNYDYLLNIIRKYTTFTKYKILLSLDDFLSTEGNYNEEVLKNVNEQQPLWTKSNKDIEPSEYKFLYESLNNTINTNFITYKHIVVEGNIDYNCILYIPNKMTMSIYDDLNKVKNIKLYVNNVYITDESILPHWLSFFVGVINCNNLPLNVSRELLQQNDLLLKIKKSVLKKTLEFLYELISKEREKYIEIYDIFCKFLKLGLYNDYKNNNDLSKLLLYKHLNNSDEYILLSEYIDRQNNYKEIVLDKKNDDDEIDNNTNNTNKNNKIYYMFGDNIEYILNSPNISFAKKNNLDVLLITDTIDEYLFKLIDSNNKIMFISFNQEVFNSNDKDKIEETEKEYEDVFNYVKSYLSEYIDKVKINLYLNDEIPCIITSQQQGISPAIDKILRNNENLKKNNENTKKIFEINLNHKFFNYIKNNYNNENEKKYVDNLIMTMYHCGLINAGYQLENPFVLTSNLFKYVDHIL